MNEGFFEAVKSRQIELVKEYVLVCSLEILDSNYQTPLHLAVINNDTEIVKLLLSHNADVNIVDKQKRTPLHWATDLNLLDMVKILCESGRPIDYNLTDMSNRTCIRIASDNRNKFLVDYLTDAKRKSLLSNRDQTELNNLAEFYKKKSFAKSTSTKHIKSIIKETPTVVDKINPLPMNSRPGTSSKLIIDYEDTEDEDDRALDELLLGTNASKKTRLSSSPIDDTLKWLRTERKSDFNLCLTEAGKRTLDYLNRNQPIEHEKKLFLKLCRDLEIQEKEEMNKQAQLNPQTPDSSQGFL